MGQSLETLIAFKPFLMHMRETEAREGSGLCLLLFPGQPHPNGVWHLCRPRDLGGPERPARQFWARDHSGMGDWKANPPEGSGRFSCVFKRDPVINSGPDPLTRAPPREQGSTGTRTLFPYRTAEGSPKPAVLRGQQGEVLQVRVPLSIQGGGSTQIHIHVWLYLKTM